MSINKSESTRTRPGLASCFASDRQRSRLPLDAATAIGVTYIALPNFVFLFGWLERSAAFALGGAMLIALVQLFKKMDCSWQLRTLALPLLAVSTVWCIFGGAGHFSYANLDWIVRDAVYGDLIYSEWPPAYRVDKNSAQILRSAFGYYLVPALISKQLGIGAANIALYAWTVLGTFCFLILLPLDTKNIGKSLTLVAIIIFFSGMDIVGILVTTGEWPIFPLRMEWWTSFSYTSISGQLFWAPNHCLPLWIGAALFYRHWGNPNFLRLAVVFAPLTLIWTPFALVALFPYFLFYLASTLFHGKPAWPTTIQIISGIASGAITAHFLTLTIDSIPSNTGISHAGGAESFWPPYLTFILAEFATLALLLYGRLKYSRGVFLLSVTILLALPFLFFGPSNDLMLRASSPPLILLAILCMQVFDEALVNMSTPTFPWLLLLVLAIGASTPLYELARAATWNRWDANYHQTLLDTQKGGVPAHYIGTLDRHRFSWLIKSPKTIPDSKNRR